MFQFKFKHIQKKGIPLFTEHCVFYTSYGEMSGNSAAIAKGKKMSGAFIFYTH